MIQCDKCRSWLHCTCVSVNPQNIPPNYTCPKCKVVRSINFLYFFDFLLQILDANGKGNFLSEFKATSILNLGNKIPLTSTTTTNGIANTNPSQQQQQQQHQQQQQLLHLLPQVKDNLTNTLMNNSS